MWWHWILLLWVLMPLVAAGCSRNRPATGTNQPSAMHMTAEEQQEAAEGNAVKKMIDEAMASGKYEAMREQLRGRLKEDPKDGSALLGLAFLQWGFDRFDEESLAKSQAHIDSILATAPKSEIAERLREQNDEWINRITDLRATPGMTLRANRDYFYSEEMPSMHAGESATFGADGELEMFAREGEKYTRAHEIPGWVYTGMDGEKYVLTRDSQLVTATPVKWISEFREDLIESGNP